MQEPRVSILIPFKNTVHFLSECLESILEQTYSNWEVLAVKDHSEDGSLNLLNLYAERDSRIKVFNNDGHGIITALRTAYKNSSGDFVTRMDSDDIMKPNRLEVMVKSLIENGKGHIAIGKVKYFSERGISNGYERYEAWLNELTEIGENYNEIYKECVIPSPCWMTYKKDLDISGAFKQDRYPEDYDLAFRFYEKRLKVIPCDEILHLWRDYDSRTSRTSEHYAQNYFLEIKLHYFLRLDYDKNRPLVLWGAGFKGKTIAKSLLENEIDFIWLCNNPQKIGKNIYGKKLVHFKTLKNIESPQSIISVANEQAQKEIKDFFKSINQQSMQDFFFFC